jgi:hypothetical protein
VIGCSDDEKRAQVVGAGLQVCCFAPRPVNTLGVQHFLSPQPSNRFLPLPSPRRFLSPNGVAWRVIPLCTTYIALEHRTIASTRGPFTRVRPRTW